MDIENSIKKIMEKTNLSREQIKQKIDEQIEEMSGLIDEEGALIIVQKNLGIDLQEHQEAASMEYDQKISDLKINTRASITGRIIQIDKKQTFSKEDGSELQLLKFYLQDISGTIICNAWNNNSLVIDEEGFRTDEIVRVVNGHVKESRTGALEINIGTKSRIQVQPDQIDMTLIPQKSSNFTNITPLNELSLTMPIVNVEGVVNSIFGPKTYNNRSGGQGKRASISIGDNNEIVYITFWNDHCVKVTNIGIGDKIQITNLNPKKNYKDPNKIDLVSSNTSLITKIEEATLEPTKIKDLKTNGGMGTVECVIQDSEDIRIITLRNGEERKVQSLIIADDSEAIKLTLWGDSTDSNLSIGSSIKIEGLLVKLNTYSQQMEASLSRSTKITQINKKITSTHTISSNILQNSENNIQPIQIVLEKGGFFDIEGKIQDLETIRKITLKNGEERDVQSLIIADNTGAIKLTLWGDKTQPNLKSGDTVKIQGIMAKINNYSKQMECTLTRTGQIEKIDKHIDVVSDFDINLNTGGVSQYDYYDNDQRNEITDIEKEDFYQFKGTIIKEIRNISVYEACAKCNRKFENCKCNPKGEMIPKIILNVTLDDETKTIKATLFNEQAEKIINESSSKIKQLKDNNELDHYLETKNLELLGKEFLFRGKAIYDNYSENYKVNINDFQELNPEKEAARIIKML